MASAVLVHERKVFPYTATYLCTGHGYWPVNYNMDTHRCLKTYGPDNILDVWPWQARKHTDVIYHEFESHLVAQAEFKAHQRCELDRSTLLHTVIHLFEPHYLIRFVRTTGVQWVHNCHISIVDYISPIFSDSTILYPNAQINEPDPIYSALKKGRLCIEDFDSNP